MYHVNEFFYNGRGKTSESLLEDFLNENPKLEVVSISYRHMNGILLVSKDIESVYNEFPMSEDGLKPCPFCGEFPDLLSSPKGWWIRCPNCLAAIPFSTKPKVIKKWNQRERMLPK